MKMSLHIHFLKQAHTFTHTFSRIIPSYTIPQVWDTHKQHHNHILTDEYAHIYHGSSHLYTKRCSSIHTYTHLDSNSRKYTSISHAHKHVHSLTHINMLTFMTMVTHSLIRMKTSIHFNTQTPYVWIGSHDHSHKCDYIHVQSHIHLHKHAPTPIHS